MSNNFKPQVLLDEQMYLSGDTQSTLLYQIREQLKETNKLLRKLVEQGEAAAAKSEALVPEDSDGPSDPEDKEKKTTDKSSKKE